MNPSAYFTSSIALKTLSVLAKARVVVEGKENVLSAGPSIYAVNHFTCLETLLFPLWLHQLSGNPVFSLAARELFEGGLKAFFDLAGVVSTEDPARDGKIIRSLVTGEADWIVFPEGQMVYDKKIMSAGQYSIVGSNGEHEPHPGAAMLTMRAELFRSYLRGVMEKEPEQLPGLLQQFGIEKETEISRRRISVVPVNITCYPLRAARRIESNLMQRFIHGAPDKVMSEVLAESASLFAGMDVTIRFGRPIRASEYVDESWLLDLPAGRNLNFQLAEHYLPAVKNVAKEFRQHYMEAVYTSVCVNTDSLLATLLRLTPRERISEDQMCRRLLYLMPGLRKLGRRRLFLHHTFRKSQFHLVTDDRFQRVFNFYTLCEEQGVIERHGGYLYKKAEMLSSPFNGRYGKRDNPVEIMANEVEPLAALQRFVRRVAAMPDFVVNFRLARQLVHEQTKIYRKARKRSGRKVESEVALNGSPQCLPGVRRIGLLLIHSYLAVPAEMAGLAKFLRRHGYPVYVVRLPGHGTSVRDLIGRRYEEWVEAVEAGYAIVNCMARDVVVCGAGVGGSLALELASRVKKAAGVFAICPPFELSDYSNKFMPEPDAWRQLLARFVRSGSSSEMMEFSPGNPWINYHWNPVTGIAEVGRLLTDIRSCYRKIEQPVVILQSDYNPVVRPQGSLELYEWLNSQKKEFCTVSEDNHVLVDSDDPSRIFRKILAFLGEVSAQKREERKKKEEDSKNR
ncbi:alpha/beta fold hydrolase [Desulforhopalus vacuolatus]|uniref:alpha/beta fold hydrolase n=1 Tax=Desulforhopalus vacuolatus TaxID=40414 RepID=UPI001962DA46|nr:alpha/beta fold hydrolase [Desulforhopalus vacuolatus]MBM9520600.1 alpha/beta fold hydrolase [Desulforhopalus vacuolatus]